MSGIFPNGGVGAEGAQGADPAILPSDLAENCVGGPLFYPTNRCNTRFDPRAANTQISEIANVLKCAGIDYDCERFDNLCVAIREMINDRIFECLEREFTTAAGACSVEQLVLVRDPNGCRRIARYSDAAALVGETTNRSVWGDSYPSTPHPLPGQETPDVHLYSTPNLGLAVAAGAVDNAVLYGPGTQNFLGEMQLSLSCTTSIELEYSQVMALEPARNGGGGCTSATVIQVDGTFPLQPDGLPINFGVMSNFQASYINSARLTLGPGTHILRFFLTSLSNVIVPARVLVQGSPVATAARWIARVSG